MMKRNVITSALAFLLVLALLTVPAAADNGEVKGVFHGGPPGHWNFADDDWELEKTQQFGQPGDIPIFFDGKAGVFRPASGHWIFADADWNPVIPPDEPRPQFGQVGDIPIVFNGTPGVFRPVGGHWIFADADWNPVIPPDEPRPQFGQVGDIPIVYDGKAGVFRPEGGYWIFAEDAATGNWTPTPFGERPQLGQEGDIPIVVDGKPGVYENGTWIFAVDAAEGNWTPKPPDERPQFGQVGDWPFAGIIIPPGPLPTHTVTFSVRAGEGAIAAAADGVGIDDGDAVEEGAEVVFTATPDPGWKVANWFVNGVAQDITTATYTIGTLEADVDVEVEFEAVPTYTVTFEEENELEDVSIQVYSDENRTQPVGDPVITDVDGKATKDLPDGGYWFTASRAGYQNYHGGFEVDGVARTVEFELIELEILEIVSIEAITNYVTVPYNTPLDDAIAALNEETEYEGVVEGFDNVKLDIEDWTSGTYGPVLAGEHTFSGEAQAPVGYVFADGVETDVSATVNIQEPPEIFTVNFGVRGDQGGAIAAAADGEPIVTGAAVEEGAEVVFTATPTPDSGWKVADWYVDDVALGITTATYTIDSLDADVMVEVEFEPSVITAINSVTDSIDVAYGTLLAAAIAALEAQTVYEGVVANPGNVTLNIINWTPEDTYDPDTPGQYDFTGEAQAPEGYVFADGVDTEVEATVTVGEAPDTFTVTFGVRAGEGAIAAEADGVGIDDGDAVDEGDEVVFTATPDPEWKVADWFVDDVALGITTATYTIDSLDADVTVEVEFEQVPPVPPKATGMIQVGAASFNDVYVYEVEGVDGAVHFSVSHVSTVREIRGEDEEPEPVTFMGTVSTTLQIMDADENIIATGTLTIPTPFGEHPFEVDLDFVL